MPKTKFLQPIQIATLKDKDWNVKPNCFHNKFYKDETESTVWKNLCQISGADPDSESVTLLSIGFISE